MNDLDLSDGLLYRENSRPEVYVIFGRAKFWIPNPNVFDAMGFSRSSVRVVADGSLANISTIPVDSTLLREYSKPEVYVMSGAKKAWIPDPKTFAAMGFSWSSVRVVPDGSLKAIPSTQLVYNARFLWGAATASYQHEGDITNINDWDFFTRSQPIRDRVAYMTTFLPTTLLYKGPRIELQPARDAVKFWDPAYYEKDFDNAKSLGLNAFRIGIEWSRIEPQKGVWDYNALSHYKQMIMSMTQKGLTPVVTLNHFTLPLWVLTPPTTIGITGGEPVPSDPYWQSLRGWENVQTIDEFIKYVSVVVNALNGQVDYWLTLNEPVGSYTGLGYVAGIWSPGFIGDGNRAKLVLHNQIDAHVRAYDTIKALDNVDADGDGIPAIVGFAHFMSSVVPANPGFGGIFGDNSRAATNFNYFINDYFLNAVVNGEEDLNYLDSLHIHDVNSPKFIIHDNWKNKLDFVGLNYYRRVYIYHDNALALSSVNFIGGRFDNGNDQNGQSHGKLNDLGWEIYPQGIHDILLKIKNQWNKPILITENGIPDQYDRYRAPFIVAHLEQVKKAMDEGANVLGYIYWSLTDNFEWASNYKPETQFGLYFIDRTGRDFLGDAKVHFSDIPLAGGKGDDILNAGVMLSSSNCVIDDVILELLNKDGSIIATTNKGQPDAVSPPLLHLIPIGARIVASNEGTRNEQVQVHWFFDGGAAIRYRLHYYLRGQDCNNDGQPDFNRKVTIGAQALQGIITASVGAAVTDRSLTTASSKFGTFTPDGGGIIPPYTGKLLVHVQPYPITFKPGSRIVTVNLTVYSEDSQSHTPISGRVIIDEKDVSSTNTPFTYTFTSKVIRRRSPDGGFEVDTIYPSGNVSAAGYNSEGIDFGFP